MHVATVTEKEGYLELRLEGDYAIGNLQAVFTSVSDAVSTGAASGILLDCRGVTGRVPTMSERYAISMAAVGLPHRLRIAMLPRPEAVDPDRFGETVAQNRGLRFRVFTVEKEAVDWLLDPAPQA